MLPKLASVACPQCRLRVGAVLVGFGFRQRHGFAYRRRPGAVQPSDLPLAGFGYGIEHMAPHGTA
jgi:hypothetical protein